MHRKEDMPKAHFSHILFSFSVYWQTIRFSLASRSYGFMNVSFLLCFYVVQDFVFCLKFLVV